MNDATSGAALAMELPPPVAWIVQAQYPYATMDPPIDGGLPRVALYTAEQMRDYARAAIDPSQQK